MRAGIVPAALSGRTAFLADCTFAVLNLNEQECTELFGDIKLRVGWVLDEAGLSGVHSLGELVRSVSRCRRTAVPGAG